MKGCSCTILEKRFINMASKAEQRNPVTCGKGCSPMVRLAERRKIRMLGMDR